MQWLHLLAVLACPLMMIVIGLFGAGKSRKTKDDPEHNVTAEDMQRLQIQMAELMEQNQTLQKEIEAFDQNIEHTIKRSG